MTKKITLPHKGDRLNDLKMLDEAVSYGSTGLWKLAEKLYFSEKLDNNQDRNEGIKAIVNDILLHSFGLKGEVLDNINIHDSKMQFKIIEMSDFYYKILSDVILKSMQEVLSKHKIAIDKSCWFNGDSAALEAMKDVVDKSANPENPENADNVENPENEAELSKIEEEIIAKILKKLEYKTVQMHPNFDDLMEIRQNIKHSGALKDIAERAKTRAIELNYEQFSKLGNKHNWEQLKKSLESKAEFNNYLKKLGWKFFMKKILAKKRLHLYYHLRKNAQNFRKNRFVANANRMTGDHIRHLDICYNRIIDDTLYDTIEESKSENFIFDLRQIIIKEQTLYQATFIHLGSYFVVSEIYNTQNDGRLNQEKIDAMLEQMSDIFNNADNIFNKLQRKEKGYKLHIYYFVASHIEGRFLNVTKANQENRYALHISNRSTNYQRNHQRNNEEYLLLLHRIKNPANIDDSDTQNGNIDNQNNNIIENSRLTSLHAQFYKIINSFYYALNTKLKNDNSEDLENNPLRLKGLLARLLKQYNQNKNFTLLFDRVFDFVKSPTEALKDYNHKYYNNDQGHNPDNGGQPDGHNGPEGPDNGQESDDSDDDNNGDDHGGERQMPDICVNEPDGAQEAAVEEHNNSSMQNPQRANDSDRHGRYVLSRKSSIVPDNQRDTRGNNLDNSNQPDGNQGVAGGGDHTRVQNRQILNDSNPKGMRGSEEVPGISLTEKNKLNQELQHEEKDCLDNTSSKVWKVSMSLYDSLDDASDNDNVGLRLAKSIMFEDESCSILLPDDVQDDGNLDNDDSGAGDDQNDDSGEGDGQNDDSGEVDDQNDDSGEEDGQNDDSREGDDQNDDSGEGDGQNDDSGEGDDQNDDSGEVDDQNDDSGKEDGQNDALFENVSLALFKDLGNLDDLDSGDIALNCPGGKSRDANEENKASVEARESKSNSSEDEDNQGN